MAVGADDDLHQLRVEVHAGLLIRARTSSRTRVMVASSAPSTLRRSRGSVLDGRTLNHQSARGHREAVEVVDLGAVGVGVRRLDGRRGGGRVGDLGVDLAAEAVALVVGRAARDEGRSVSASAARVCRAASIPESARQKSRK